MNQFGDSNEQLIINTISQQQQSIDNQQNLIIQQNQTLNETQTSQISSISTENQNQNTLINSINTSISQINTENANQTSSINSLTSSLNTANNNITALSNNKLDVSVFTSQVSSQNLIDQTQNTNISNNTTNLNTEITNRQNADTALQNNINLKLDTSTFNTTIANYRTSANQDTIDADQNNNINTRALQSDLQNEINTRTSQDALKLNITDFDTFQTSNTNILNSKQNVSDMINYWNKTETINLNKIQYFDTSPSLNTHVPVYNSTTQKFEFQLINQLTGNTDQINEMQDYENTSKIDQGIMYYNIADLKFKSNKTVTTLFNENNTYFNFDNINNYFQMKSVNNSNYILKMKNIQNSNEEIQWKMNGTGQYNILVYDNITKILQQLNGITSDYLNASNINTFIRTNNSFTQLQDATGTLNMNKQNINDCNTIQIGKAITAECGIQLFQKNALGTTKNIYIKPYGDENLQLTAQYDLYLPDRCDLNQIWYVKTYGINKNVLSGTSIYNLINNIDTTSQISFSRIGNINNLDIYNAGNTNYYEFIYTGTINQQYQLPTIQSQTYQVPYQTATANQLEFGQLSQIINLDTGLINQSKINNLTNDIQNINTSITTVSNSLSNQIILGHADSQLTGTLQNNQILQWNGAKWTNASFNQTSNLDSLTDVVISNPQNNQVIQYNGTNWVNQTVASIDLSEYQKKISENILDMQTHNIQNIKDLHLSSNQINGIAFIDSDNLIKIQTDPDNVWGYLCAKRNDAIFSSYNQKDINCNTLEFYSIKKNALGGEHSYVSYMNMLYNRMQIGFCPTGFGVAAAIGIACDNTDNNIVKIGKTLDMNYFNINKLIQLNFQHSSSSYPQSNLLIQAFNHLGVSNQFIQFQQPSQNSSKMVIHAQEINFNGNLLNDCSIITCDGLKQRVGTFTIKDQSNNIVLDFSNKTTLNLNCNVLKHNGYSLVICSDSQKAIYFKNQADTIDQFQIVQSGNDVNIVNYLGSITQQANESTIQGRNAQVLTIQSITQRNPYINFDDQGSSGNTHGRVQWVTTSGPYFQIGSPEQGDFCRLSIDKLLLNASNSSSTASLQINNSNGNYCQIIMNSGNGVSIVNNYGALDIICAGQMTQYPANDLTQNYYNGFNTHAWNTIFNICQNFDIVCQNSGWAHVNNGLIAIQSNEKVKINLKQKNGKNPPGHYINKFKQIKINTGAYKENKQLMQFFDYDNLKQLFKHATHSYQQKNENERINDREYFDENDNLQQEQQITAKEENKYIDIVSLQTYQTLVIQEIIQQNEDQQQQINQLQNVIDQQNEKIQVFTQTQIDFDNKLDQQQAYYLKQQVQHEQIFLQSILKKDQEIQQLTLNNEILQNDIQTLKNTFVNQEAIIKQMKKDQLKILQFMSAFQTLNQQDQQSPTKI